MCPQERERSPNDYSLCYWLAMLMTPYDVCACIEPARREFDLFETGLLYTTLLRLSPKKDY